MKLNSNNIGMAPIFNSSVLISERLTIDTELTTIDNPEWDQDICLFVMPEHLRRRWWSLAADEIVASLKDCPNFEIFKKYFIDFAVFKDIPISSNIEFKVIIRAPNNSSNLWDLVPPKTKGIVNLGDENAHIFIGSNKITIQPGEGCWIPSGYNFRLADVSSNADIEVLLSIS